MNAFIAWVLTLPIITFIIINYRRRRENPYRMIATFIFYVYIMNVISLIWFPISIGASADYDFVLKHVFEFKPLFMRWDFPQVLFYKQAILNVVMTIPFGLGIHFVFKRFKFRKLLAASFLFTLMIELGQLLISLSIRYPYRTVDINDLFLNTLGGLIGYMIFVVLNKLVGKVLYKFKDGLLKAYLKEIFA